MFRFTILASGSSGNAALVSCGQTHILIDAGISARRIVNGLRELDVSLDQLAAILITHDHSDHIGGLNILMKQCKVPIYATIPTCQTIAAKSPHAAALLQPQNSNMSLVIGECTVSSFPTPHDTMGSVGYSITGGGLHMVLCTDLGFVTDEINQVVQGCDLLVCEANHDVDWVRTGPYTNSLKQRVLGNYGHLSNEAGAQLALLAAQSGTRHIVLAHLSSENNSPSHALQVVADCLTQAGIDLEHTVHLSVAPRMEPGLTWHLESQKKEVASC